MSYEGSRSEIVVVDKSFDLLRWFAGTDERTAAINDWQDKYQWTPIVTVLGIASLIGYLVILTHDISQDEKKWWYWALAATGVLQPANMLSSRSPRLFRIASTNFDMVTQVLTMRSPGFVINRHRRRRPPPHGMSIRTPIQPSYTHTLPTRIRYSMW